MIMLELRGVKLELFKFFGDWVFNSGKEWVLIYGCTTRTGILQELLTELIPLLILYSIHQQATIKQHLEVVQLIIRMVTVSEKFAMSSPKCFFQTLTWVLEQTLYTAIIRKSCVGHLYYGEYWKLEMKSLYWRQSDGVQNLEINTRVELTLDKHCRLWLRVWPDALLS